MISTLLFTRRLFYIISVIFLIIRHHVFLVSHARFQPRSPPIECFTIPSHFVLTLENTKEGFVVIFVCNLKMDYFVIYVQAPASDNGSLLVLSKRKVYKKRI